jgi:bacterioferritin
LGGEPNFNLVGLATRSHSQYGTSKANHFWTCFGKDLLAERIAVESYNEIIRYLGNDDPTTRIAMEQIMAKEEEHAEDMKQLLETLSKDERFAEHA